MKIFKKQGIFPQSNNFSIVKKHFRSCENFPQARKLSTNKVCHKFFFLHQIIFPQTKILTQSKKFSANKDQKDSLKKLKF